MDLKEEFVIQAQKGVQSFSSLCREYGISRKTGYKWLARFTDEGVGGLSDQKTRPASSPEKLPEEVVCKLVNLKQDHPAWGPKKIHALYLRTTTEAISLSSVKRVLKASGLVREQKRRRQAPVQRLNKRHEALKPNDIWSVDFKGWWYAKDRARCEPLTVRDEFSCYILEARMLASTRTEAVREAFERIFRHHGLPRVIRSDNGSPFASARGLRGLTKLSVWWVSLGIELERIDPGKPSQNGSHERMHRDLKTEIQRQIKGSGIAVQSSLDVWRTEFNELRPHERLDMKSPPSVYRNSERSYTESLAEIEYSLYYRSRIINKHGYMKLDGSSIFVSESLAGVTVGVTDLNESHYALYFDYIELGLIDRDTYAFKPFSQKQISPNSVGGDASSEP